MPSGSAMCCSQITLGRTCFGIVTHTHARPRTHARVHTHARTHAHKHAHTHTIILRLSGLCLGLPGLAGTRKNIHPLTPIMVINHPLSASSVYYDPWHPLYSVNMPDSLFPQSLSKFSLVYLLTWHPPLHTQYISSPNHCLFF